MVVLLALLRGLTFVGVVEGHEGDHEEGGGVLAGVDQVGEGALGVTVTAQALHEAEPGRETLDDGAHSICIAVTHGFFWRDNGMQVNP